MDDTPEDISTIDRLVPAEREGRQRQGQMDRKAKPKRKQQKKARKRP
jgi:hypothetical protein